PARAGCPGLQEGRAMPALVAFALALLFTTDARDRTLAARERLGSVIAGGAFCGGGLEAYFGPLVGSMEADPEPYLAGSRDELRKVDAYRLQRDQAAYPARESRFVQGASGLLSEMADPRADRLLATTFLRFARAELRIKDRRFVALSTFPIAVLRTPQPDVL